MCAAMVAATRRQTHTLRHSETHQPGEQRTDTTQTKHTHTQHITKTRHTQLSGHSNAQIRLCCTEVDCYQQRLLKFVFDEMTNSTTKMVTAAQAYCCSN